MEQRESAGANRGHRGGTVGLENFRDDADGIGELFLARQHLFYGAPGEMAVAYLPPSRTEPADLADREWREVIVQHESVAPVAFDIIEDLLVEDRA